LIKEHWLHNIFLAVVKYDLRGDFISQVGLAYVRGCEIEGMLDANGRVIEEGPDPKPHIPGGTRTFRVLLDNNQYQIDLDNIAAGKEVSGVFTKDECST